VDQGKLLQKVKGILVRNYIDSQRLDVDVIGSSVYIAGELKIFDYHPSQKHGDPMDRILGIKKTLVQIERQIRSIAEVTHLEIKLTNWRQTGSQWIPKREPAFI